MIMLLPRCQGQLPFRDSYNTEGTVWILVDTQAPGAFILMTCDSTQLRAQ